MQKYDDHLDAVTGWIYHQGKFDVAKPRYIYTDYWEGWDNHPDLPAKTHYILGHNEEIYLVYSFSFDRYSISQAQLNKITSIEALYVSREDFISYMQASVLNTDLSNLWEKPSE